MLLPLSVIILLLTLTFWYAVPILLVGVETNGLHLAGPRGHLDHSISLISNPYTPCLIYVLT
jgi:hypothetical protein